MLIAMDRSTAIGRVALFTDSGDLHTSVVDEGAGHGDADSLLRQLLETSGVGISEITRFAVGIGPGSFSGIRSAIALFSGLALPISAQVEGVNSAAAAALDFFNKNADYDTVSVIGDARRGHYWIATLTRAFEVKNSIEDFQLVNAVDVAESVSCHAAVISPDLKRIGERLESAFPGRVFEARPTAEAVGCLALRGSSSIPLPIYLHPAVV